MSIGLPWIIESDVMVGLDPHNEVCPPVPACARANDGARCGCAHALGCQ
jgi:hypothetical protein